MKKANILKKNEIRTRYIIFKKMYIYYIQNRSQKLSKPIEKRKRFIISPLNLQRLKTGGKRLNFAPM